MKSIKYTMLAVAAIALSACGPTSEGDGMFDAVGQAFETTSDSLTGAFGSKEEMMDDAKMQLASISSGDASAYLDDVEAALRQALVATSVRVVRRDDTILLNMPSNVTFEKSSFSLRPDFLSVVASVGDVADNYVSTTLEIVGHTDSDGSDNFNLDLSQKRAAAVREALVEAGVQTIRVASKGLGESEPIASNKTKVGRTLNRRVEIIVRPVTNT